MSKRKDKPYIAAIRPTPFVPGKSDVVVAKVRGVFKSAGIYHVRTFTLKSNGAVHCSETGGIGKKYAYIANPNNRNEQYLMGLIQRERYEIVEIPAKPVKAPKSPAASAAKAQTRTKSGTHSHGILDGFKDGECDICLGTHLKLVEGYVAA